MKKFIKDHKYLLLTVLFIILSFLIFGLNSFHNNIWYDEAHQMLLNRLSVLDIISESKNDTSGPLYAIILKLVTGIFGSSLPVARLTSLAIFSIIFILAFYPIRRLYNLKTSTIFSIIILFVGPSFFASIEIRNYSLALVSTLGATIYSLLYLKENKTSDLLKYFLFSIAALYSHVYAMISILFLIILNSIYSLISKKGRKIIIANIILILCFIPWLNVILNSQKGRVEQEFWVTKPTMNTLIESIKNLLTQNMVINYILLAILIMSILISIIRKKELKTILYLLVPSIICLAFFYIWSLYKTPLYTAKYIVPVCGIIYLIIAKILANNKLTVPTILFIVLLIPTFITNYKYEKSIIDDNETRAMVEFIQYVPTKQKVFYNTYEFGLGISEYYFPNSKHYIKPNSNISLTGPKIFGELITNKKMTEEYIIAYTYKNESEYNLNELFEEGYEIQASHPFDIRYNEGCRIYILKKKTMLQYN